MTLRYIRWRNGKPRFEPSQREKDLSPNFRGQDLKHHDGRWFTWEEAKVWSDHRYEEIVAARDAARGGPKRSIRRKWAPKMPRVGYVYFLFAGDAVKIGFSRGPLKRQEEIGIGMSREPDAIHAVRAGSAHEMALHRALHTHRLRGEWFRRCPEVMKMLHQMIDDPSSVFHRLLPEYGGSSDYNGA
jgi:hypothetical protein